ncbi:hypothetical protein [Halobellus rubicundus]|uniref:Uncharacterized protein n=1 Tax=Halobellus rubicundus TaxID=2996466 RepID=A0ABD5MEX2_9EURY
MIATDKTVSNEVTTTFNSDEIPCVQYGFPEDKGPFREPKLRTIFDPIPEGAITVSPIYLLTQKQYDRQERFETGYEVSEYRIIATELQDECESKGRVRYPVHVESDVLREEGGETLIEWFREFVEEWLNVPFKSCDLYFSGSRSIHVHVPRFVSGEDARKRLKQTAESFCEETGAELDCGLYSSKRLFRLPGVKHEKTGLPKVEIGDTWDDVEVFKKVQQGAEIPESYEVVLRDLFILDKTVRLTTEPEGTYNPFTKANIFESERSRLRFNTTEAETRLPLIEQQEHPDDPADVPLWAQYNYKEFSPYALAAGNGRSVAALEVKGGAFARRDVREGATLIPAYFFGAQGCAGREFIKETEHAPLQLSDRDYEKWDYAEGDYVVIIGGQSRSSRIFGVKPYQAATVGKILMREGGGRAEALEYLSNEEFDIGAAGSAVSKPSVKTKRRADNSTSQPKPSQKSEAAKLQQRAEQYGIKSLGHIERLRVANRLLKQDWEVAWEWFKQQFGSEFKPDVTWTHFKSICENTKYGNDYSHVKVPKRPY